MPHVRIEAGFEMSCDCVSLRLRKRLSKTKRLYALRRTLIKLYCLFRWPSKLRFIVVACPADHYAVTRWLTGGTARQEIDDNEHCMDIGTKFCPLDGGTPSCAGLLHHQVLCLATDADRLPKLALHLTKRRGLSRKNVPCAGGISEQQHNCGPGILQAT